MNELRLPSNLDQAGIVQLADMVRDGGLCYRKFIIQGTRREFKLSGNALKNVEPGWVGEGFRDGVKTFGRHEFSLAISATPVVNRARGC
jgi:hypothetical protein